MKVSSSIETKDQSKLKMNELEDLKIADKDSNGILSLNELKNCKDKTDFLKTLEKAMEKFNNKKSKNYSKNLFEFWS